MKIALSNHVKQRMKERAVEEKDVIWTLCVPDWYKPALRNRICVRKKIDGHILEVIYLEENDAMIVITCYWI